MFNAYEGGGRGGKELNDWTTKILFFVRLLLLGIDDPVVLYAAQGRAPHSPRAHGPTHTETRLKINHSVRYTRSLLGSKCFSDKNCIGILLYFIFYIFIMIWFFDIMAFE